MNACVLWMRHAAVGALVGALACSTRTPEPRAAEQALPLDSLRAQIAAMTADAPCDDVAQCRSTAFGAKPCGGPWRYLIYATQATDSSALAAAVAEYNRRDDERNRELGLVSDCRMEVPPRLACRERRCVAMQ